MPISKITFFTITFLLSTAVLAGPVKKPVSVDDPAAARSTLVLKKYMQDFGSLVAGMEIMRVKEKNPDWEAIAITLNQMEKTLKELQAADKAKNYVAFTTTLERNLKEVQAYGKKKDKRVFESFQKLTETCFQCHAAHRPSDFLIPKEKSPRLSSGKSSAFLWQGIED